MTDNNQIDIETYKTYKKSKFKEGDILIVSGGHMRVFSHFDGEGNCCCFEGGMRSGAVTIWEHYQKATEEEIACAFRAFDLSKVIHFK